MNLILCGFMGCGKTTVALALGKLTGRRVVDTDSMVVEACGMPIPAVFRMQGENGFRELEYEACRKIATMDGLIVATGGGALTMQRNVEALRRNGRIILLQVPFDVIAGRVSTDGSRPLFEDIAAARRLYEARCALYEAAADCTVNGDQPAIKVARDVLDTVNL